MSEGVPGTIYLLHFERPYRHARHYIGWTKKNCLNARLDHHRAGSGSRLMAAVSAAGITFTIARLWTGTRNDERALKRKKNAPARLCPICRPKRGGPRGQEEGGTAAEKTTENDPGQKPD